MQQLLQDSLAICRACKKPDLFLTMTANGSWPEITENLLPGKETYLMHYYDMILTSFLM
jgi:Helitron helicase-like domain at N-terminus